MDTIMLKALLDNAYILPAKDCYLSYSGTLVTRQLDIASLYHSPDLLNTLARELVDGLRNTGWRIDIIVGLGGPEHALADMACLHMQGEFFRVPVVHAYRQEQVLHRADDKGMVMYGDTSLDMRKGKGEVIYRPEQLVIDDPTYLREGVRALLVLGALSTAEQVRQVMSAVTEAGGEVVCVRSIFNTGTVLPADIGLHPWSVRSLLKVEFMQEEVPAL